MQIFDLVVTRSYDEHLEMLDKVFELLRFAGLTLKPSKCVFLASEVKFLGFVVGRHGLSTDPKKVAAMQQFPRPQNSTDLKSFIGLCSYYRRFIRNFASIARPLTTLMGGDPRAKKKPIEWSEECERAFIDLKEAMTSAPVLRYPDPEKPYIIETDASKQGLGAVLEQRHEENGALQPVAFASRALRKSENSWASCMH